MFAPDDNWSVIEYPMQSENYEFSLQAQLLVHDFTEQCEVLDSYFGAGYCYQYLNENVYGYSDGFMLVFNMKQDQYDFQEFVSFGACESKFGYCFGKTAGYAVELQDGDGTFYTNYYEFT